MRQSGFAMSAAAIIPAAVFVAVLALLALGWHLGAASARADADLAMSRMTAQAEATERARETGWRAKLEEERTNAQTRISAAEADADAANVAAGSLRDAIRKYQSRTCPTPSIASGGAATEETGNLLGNMLERLSESAATISKFADQSYNAAVTCNASAKVLE